MKKLSKSLSMTRKPVTTFNLPSPKTIFPLIGKPDSSLVQSSEKPLVPLPTVSLCVTSQSHLSQYVKSHLSSSFSAQDFLHFLKNKLHYHPRFTQFDLQIFKWAQTVDSYRHDHSIYEWMVKTLAVTQRIDDLGPVLDAILSNPCPCSDDSIFCCPRLERIFQFALESYCRVGRLDDASATLNKMRKCIDGKPRATIYNILINGFVRHLKHREAIEMYNEMVKDQVKPDVCTFNILISSYCRNSMIHLAMDVFQEMRKTKGCVPNVITFNTLVRGFFRERKFKEGIGIAYEMLDMGCTFSIATCEIVLGGMCKEGMIVEAYELFVDLLNREAVPHGFDCFGILHALCSGGEVERALMILDKSWKSGHVPSVVACTTVIEELKNLGKIESGFDLTQRMLKEGILPDSVTFNCLVEALCFVGRTSDANQLRLLASRKGLSSDGVTYMNLVHGFTRERNTKEGEAVIEEMLDGGFIPDIGTYNRLMGGLNDRSKLIHGRKSDVIKNNHF